MSTLNGALKQAEQFKNKYGNYSGPGSLPEVTGLVIRFIDYVLERYEMNNIIDAPCGDWSWMKYINLKGKTYLGFDIVDFIIQENIKNHTREGIYFKVMDIVNQEIVTTPHVIICRDFLFHLRDCDILKVLQNFKNSRAKYIITTSFDYIEENEEFRPFSPEGQYGFRKVNLQKAPFNFPDTIEKIYETTDYQCKGRMVGLWELQMLLK